MCFCEPLNLVACCSPPGLDPPTGRHRCPTHNAAMHAPGTSTRPDMPKREGPLAFLAVQRLRGVRAGYWPATPRPGWVPLVTFITPHPDVGPAGTKVRSERADRPGT